MTRTGFTGLAVSGSVGMFLFGTLELWAERVGQNFAVLLVVLFTAPFVALAGFWGMTKARLERKGTPALRACGSAASTARTGWLLLVTAAVAVAQAGLFGLAVALSESVGCGGGVDDWCGLGSVIFLGTAVVIASVLGCVAVAMWAVSKTAAARGTDAAPTTKAQGAR